MGCDPWDYDDKFLITLCMDCHESEEIIKKVLDGELAFSLNAIGFPTITVLRLVLRDEERLQRNIEIYRKGGKIA